MATEGRAGPPGLAFIKTADGFLKGEASSKHAELQMPVMLSGPVKSAAVYMDLSLRRESEGIDRKAAREPKLWEYK